VVRVVVHDVEADDLVEIGSRDDTVFRVNRALVETDLSSRLTAAETVLHGGPAALLGASSGEALRAQTALSLLEPTSSPGWRMPSGSSGSSPRVFPSPGSRSR